jgi:hypothetical protein
MVFISELFATRRRYNQDCEADNQNHLAFSLSFAQICNQEMSAAMAFSPTFA